MADEITVEQIVTAATGADEHTVDGETTKQVSITEQIMAAKYAAAQKSKGKQGIRFLRMIPPSAAGDC